MLKDVGGVGQHGQIIEVKDGFALNSLIPSGKAVQATADKVKHHEAQMKVLEMERAKQNAALKAQIESLNGAEIVTTARTTEKGGLFKSIVVADIAKAIFEQKNMQIPESTIQLAKPIKEAGEHTIQISGAGASAPIRFVVKSQ